MGLRDRRVPPQLLLLASIASVQFGAGIAVKLFAQSSPVGVVALRLGLSAIVAVTITRPKLRGHTRRELAAVIGYGLVLGGMNWSFYEALNRLPLGVAVTVEFLGPLSVAVSGSRRPLDLLWVALAGGGVALLGTGDVHGITVTGILFALIAAVGWASYILLAQQVGRGFGTLDGLAIALSVGAVVVLPAAVITAGGTLLHPAVLGAGFGVAMLSSLIPFSLEIMALRRLPAATFGLLMSVEPAIAALVGVTVLGQPLTLITAVAIAMVICASAGATITNARRARARSAVVPPG